jgi:Spy/CpxP family protein refolding chaperone
MVFLMLMRITHLTSFAATSRTTATAIALSPAVAVTSRGSANSGMFQRTGADHSSAFNSGVSPSPQRR